MRSKRSAASKRVSEDNFPPTRVDPEWRHLVHAASKAVARIQAGDDEPGKLFQRHSQLIEDLEGATRTCIYFSENDGFFSGGFDSECAAADAFSALCDGGAPRVGSGASNPGERWQCACQSALDQCGAVGERYYFAVVSVHPKCYLFEQMKLLVSTLRSALRGEHYCAKMCFAYALRPDRSLPANTVRVSVVTA